jgi:hypothetical protein
LNLNLPASPQRADFVSRAVWDIYDVIHVVIRGNSCGNPADGTRYDLRTSGLTIVSGGNSNFEPMIEYFIA